MKEKQIKYMGNIIKYKEVNIPNKTDNYNRPLVFRVAKQSDAEQVTDEITATIRWSAGAFFDGQIDKYIEDEVYEIITEDEMIKMFNENN